MEEMDALERRLLPPKAKGTPDEFFLLATRRGSLAESEAGTDREQQHLALAAFFGGRAFQAGERDADRLSAFLALFRRAQAKQCFPLQLQIVQARIVNHLRVSGGASEPKVLTKKAKTVFTHVAMYMISDAHTFDEISDDDKQWSDDKGMQATVHAGQGLFISTGADGWVRHELRVVDGDDLALLSREYKDLSSSAEPVLLAVPSGVVRLGQPLANAEECLDVKVEPGVYRVAMYNLKYGEKCVIVANRTDLGNALNELPNGATRYGQSTAGILVT
jgi:hypothetical protein